MADYEVKPQILDEIVRRIVEVAHPEKIIRWVEGILL